MNSYIVKSPCLSENEIGDALALVELSNKHDDTKYIFDVNEQLYLLYYNHVLVSVASIFSPKTDEAEVVIITEKDYRKNGYYKELIQEIKTDLKKRGIKSILTVCDNNSIDGINVVGKSSFTYEFSEFLMEHNNLDFFETRADIDVVKALEKDMEKVIELNTDIFSTSRNDAENIIKENFKNPLRNLYTINLGKEIIGLIGIYAETKRLYIYGVGIILSFRNKGYGRDALNAVVAICKELSGRKKIMLEVETNNENALGLYRSCGFELQTEFRYYRDIV